jgi:hypothetical protein
MLLLYWFKKKYNQNILNVYSEKKEADQLFGEPIFCILSNASQNITQKNY